MGVAAAGCRKSQQVATPFKGLRNRRAWLLALYFGLVNCGYMSMVAWLPAYYQQLGWDVLSSGSLLAFMTIFQVIAALLMPALAQRGVDRRPLLGISLLAQAVGYLGLLMAPLQQTHLWVALIGFGLGACFALSLLLTLDHRRDPRKPGNWRRLCKAWAFDQRDLAMADRLAAGVDRQLRQRLGGAGGDRGGNADADPGIQPGNVPHRTVGTDITAKPM